jgi:benzoyl-CoA reductase/2-hydroxyglutaryl-CoA dehydratase subunit BcrC/BadD/HgdB
MLSRKSCRPQPELLSPDDNEEKMMSRDLPQAFESFAQARKNGFLELKQLKDDGKNIVGIFCSYTPREVIYAAGAVCVSLCAVSDETIPQAEKVLPKNLCPLIKASYGYAVTEKCPYMYFSDLIVGETTCDGKKKMYELLNEIKDTYVMQLPQTQNTERAKALWRGEVQALKERLEEKFNVEITDAKLSVAIRLCNEERRNFIELYELAKLSPPPISGYELHAVLNGSNFNFDKRAQNKEVKSLIARLKEKYAKGKCEISADAPRILVTGCPSGGVVHKIIKPVEEAGAVVVCFENCVGTKNFENLVEESGDPIGAIAARYLNIPCSVMIPNKAWEENLKRYIRDYNVTGVVDIVLSACHTYEIESAAVKKAVENAGASYMLLETDYSSSDAGQLKTRLEAFVEMLQARNGRAVI